MSGCWGVGVLRRRYGGGADVSVLIRDDHVGAVPHGPEDVFPVKDNHRDKERLPPNSSAVTVRSRRATWRLKSSPATESATERDERADPAAGQAVRMFFGTRTVHGCARLRFVEDHCGGCPSWSFALNPVPFRYGCSSSQHRFPLRNNARYLNVSLTSGYIKALVGPHRMGVILLAAIFPIACLVEWDRPPERLREILFFWIMKNEIESCGLTLERCLFVLFFALCISHTVRQESKEVIAWI